MSVRSVLFCAVVVCAVVVCAACAGNDTVIAVDDYSGDCATDGDCVIVAFGDACDACLADNQTIAVDDLQRYRDDVDAAIATCAAWSERRTAECIVPVPPIAPTCVDGACVIPDDGEACTFPAGFCVGVDP